MKQNKLYVILFTVLAVLVFSTNTTGQTFTFEPQATELTDTVNAEVVFDFDLINTSTEDITVVVERTKNEKPANWSSSLCFFQNCFAPFVDSVSTRLSPGESAPFSVHVFALLDEGSASVVVTAFNEDSPSESYTYTLTATASITSVEDNEGLEKNFKLFQNYPNPFNPVTKISFYVPNNIKGDVSLEVYDLLGRKISTLITEPLSAGVHEIWFDASYLTSGIYFYRLSAGGKTISKKMILEK